MQCSARRAWGDRKHNHQNTGIIRHQEREFLSKALQSLLQPMSSGPESFHKGQGYWANELNNPLRGDQPGIFPWKEVQRDTSWWYSGNNNQEETVQDSRVWSRQPLVRQTAGPLRGNGLSSKARGCYPRNFSLEEHCGSFE